MISRRLFGIPQLAYVDDFLRLVPGKWAPVAEYISKKMHELLGIPLKDGKFASSEVIDAFGRRIAADSS